MFIEYNLIEEQIFKETKQYFERLPASSDDYKNMFYDLVSQYRGGEGEYVGMEQAYEQAIEGAIMTSIQRLQGTDKKELEVFYERNFMDNYKDDRDLEFIYTANELVHTIGQRFKAWIEDNFRLDDMLEGLEE